MVSSIPDHEERLVDADYTLKPTRNIERKPEKYHSCCLIIWLILSVLLLLITLPVSPFFCFKMIAQYERAVIFRLGCLRKKILGPGLIFILPCIDSFTRIDLRVEIFDIPPQEMLTRDSTSVELDAVVYYQVMNPIKCIVNIMKYKDATRIIAATVLRNCVGRENLTDLIVQRSRIAKTVSEIIDRITKPWGVYVSRVEIKEVSLPISMQRSMAAEAEARRQALGKVKLAEGEMNAAKIYKDAADIMSANPVTIHVSLPISMQRAMAAEAEAKRQALGKIKLAEGELSAARIYKEAADMISGNPVTIHLRYLDTLNAVSAEEHTTIVFPFPIKFAPLLK